MTGRVACGNGFAKLFQLGFAARVKQAEPGLHEAAAAVYLGGTDKLERTRLGQTLKNRRLMFAQQREIVGIELNQNLGGLLRLRHCFAHNAFDEFRRDGNAPDNFLGAFQRDLHQGAFGLLNDLRDGAAKRLDDALVQFQQFIPLLEHLLAENLFAIQPSALVSGLLRGAKAMLRIASRRQRGNAHVAERFGECDGLKRLHIRRCGLRPNQFRLRLRVCGRRQ